MSGNAKFRFLLASIVLALLVVTSPVSWGDLDYAEEKILNSPPQPVPSLEFLDDAPPSIEDMNLNLEKLLQQEAMTILQI